MFDITTKEIVSSSQHYSHSNDLFIHVMLSVLLPNSNSYYFKSKQQVHYSYTIVVYTFISFMFISYIQSNVALRSPR